MIVTWLDINLIILITMNCWSFWYVFCEDSLQYGWVMDQNVKKYKFYCLDVQHCSSMSVLPSVAHNWATVTAARACRLSALLWSLPGFAYSYVFTEPVLVHEKYSTHQKRFPNWFRSVPFTFHSILKCHSLSVGFSFCSVPFRSV